MDCLFCKIAAGEIPSKKAYEDDEILAFHDIAPEAPMHILFVPKTHIDSADALNSENAAIVAKIFAKIPGVVAEQGVTNGYRILTNVGEDGGQSVKHLHFHVIGGTKLPVHVFPEKD